MNIFEYLGLVISPLLTFGLVLFLAKNWFLERLKNSIKHEYDKDIEEIKKILKQESDKNLEDYRYQVEVKRKAELVAKLLAHWLSKPLDREELNRITFECFLWLPDDIATDLGALLSHKRLDEVNLRTVVVQIRKHLHAGENFSNFDKLEPWQVIQFDPKVEGD